MRGGKGCLKLFPSYRTTGCGCGGGGTDLDPIIVVVLGVRSYMDIITMTIIVGV